ncbi:hypothetical protein GZH47_25320 [Paenibacillus rhizovicinus]|uniref:Uncharacterized protein n=1 Tax=Paenibacillus rhizovicinus TaxID=2704463 RepID=A0A6C0P5G7_9BACL|nr:hypothetical protein [Paenibacillus rhizovicinus]QHW33790.1 hypothetical protein GZH47_25320 [Paenibacillus rhizovicinus]
MTDKKLLYLFNVLLLAVILFLIVASVWHTSTPVTDFFLALLASHFIIDRLGSNK